jgi:hypothetical protein
MVARVQALSGGLLVTFSRDGEQPDIMPAQSGERAASTVIMMVASRLVLYPGDSITVERDDGRPEPDDQPPAPDLPVASRSSHYS